MDYYADILRLLVEFLQLAREHPVWASLWAGALVVLRHLAGGIGSAAVSHLCTEYVLKRALPPPAPSPAEEALTGRVEVLSRNLERTEAERDAARELEARAREETERLREERDAERRRADRLESALRKTQRPPRVAGGSGRERGVGEAGDNLFG